MFEKKKRKNSAREENYQTDNPLTNKVKTPEQEAKLALITTLSVAIFATIMFAALNLWSISKYDASTNNTNVDTSVDEIKKFLTTSNTEKYTQIINKHTNPVQMKSQDIKAISSTVGREHPFVAFLNKSTDNSSTKLIKFIYTELKPAIISYKLTNSGSLPLVDETNDIDLTKVGSIINIKDENLKSYTYTYVAGTGSDFTITASKESVPADIILFDVQQFTLENVGTSQVSIAQGKYTLVLNLMEECNNIRLEAIDSSKKYVVLKDTITGKTVKITKK